MAQFQWFAILYSSLYIYVFYMLVRWEFQDPLHVPTSLSIPIPNIDKHTQNVKYYIRTKWIHFETECWPHKIKTVVVSISIPQWTRWMLWVTQASMRSCNINLLYISFGIRLWNFSNFLMNKIDYLIFQMFFFSIIKCVRTYI